MNRLIGMTDSSDRMSGKPSETMEHYEAIEMMASERYLLDELTPEVRDAYEEHMFGCTECADEVRFGAAFVDQATKILPEMTSATASATQSQQVTTITEKRNWFAWLRPSIIVPAFACLLALVGYQNLVVYPKLEAAAVEPRLLPQPTVLAGVTRGASPIVYADLVIGSTISVPLTPSGNYAAYKFDFYDSKNKLVWTRILLDSEVSDDMTSIWLPGRVKQDSYKLAISGVTAVGENILLRQHFFELQVKK